MDENEEATNGIRDGQEGGCQEGQEGCRDVESGITKRAGKDSIHSPLEQTKAPKYCECGCGGMTLPYPQTIRKRDQVKGEFARYLKGHYHPRRKPSQAAFKFPKPKPEICECRICKKSLPFTPTFFRTDRTKPHGVSRICLPCNKIALTESYWANRAERLPKMRAYRAANVEKFRRNCREWHQNHKEYAGEKLREWRNSNRERDLENHMRWRKENPEKHAASRQRARDKRRALEFGVYFEIADYRAVYDRACGICGICLLPVAWNSVTWDHIVALSCGGPHSIDNLQPAHSICNNLKSTFSLAVARERVAKLIAQGAYTPDVT